MSLLRNRQIFAFFMGISFLIISNANASPQVLSLQRENKEYEKEITAFKKREKQIKEDLRKVEKTNFPGNCSSECCPNHIGCSLVDYTDTGVTRPNPCLNPRDLCMDLYEAIQSNPKKRLSRSCQDKVNDCGEVKKQEAIKKLKSDLETLNEDKKDRQDKMKENSEEIWAICPNCGSTGGGVDTDPLTRQLQGFSMQDPYMQPPTSRFAQGVTALTPSILGALNMGLNTLAMGSYSNNYASYLNQAAQIGATPMLPQMPMMGMGMGGYGMGMGGYGMGMSGYGMGMGGYGIGGLAAGYNPSLSGWGNPYNSMINPMIQGYSNPYLSIGYNNPQLQILDNLLHENSIPYPLTQTHSTLGGIF